MQQIVSLITGAGSGLGRSIAREFARRGAFVGVSDFNFDAASTTAAQIQNDGGRAVPIRLDVSSEEQVGQAFDTLSGASGSLVNSLVNNAGHQFITPLIDCPLDQWQKMLRVHLDGPFLCTREMLRRYRAADRKGGSIIFIGSVHSKEASVEKSPYVTAKHGVLGLCRATAKEAAVFGISSNTICPGFVKTPLVEAQIPKLAEKFHLSHEEVVKNVMLRNTVDGEWTTEQDIADACAFLAAFPTNAITGQSLIVSHGWHME
jgi:3-hydroxybutyrate dehydrogenase